MPLIRTLLLLAALCGSSAVLARASLSESGAPDADGLLPVEEAFRLLPARRVAQTLRIEWTISPGYYLYRGKLAFEVLAPQGFRLAPPQLPAGQKVQDPEFGAVEVYRGIVAADFVLPPGLKAPLKLRVRYQGCADIGICYPPQMQVVDIPAIRT